MSRPAVKGRPDSPGARQLNGTGRKKGRKEGRGGDPLLCFILQAQYHGYSFLSLGFGGLEF